MQYFIQQIINGVTLGSVYALIAIGYTMVYGIIGMVNFAHGEIYMIGSFIAVIGFTLLMADVGVTFVPLVLVLVLFGSVFFTAVYGWVVERIAYRPLRGGPRLAPLISAIGVSIFLQNYVRVTQGARPRAVPPLVRGEVVFGNGAYAASISYTQVIIVAVTLVLMVLFTLLIRRTSLGRSQRACQQDRVMASLLGIDVDRTISLTFIIGAALAAVAGVMVTLRYGVVDFYIGFVAGIKAFTAAVLGGIGSLPGAVLGGFIIGLIETMFSGYFSIDYKDVAVFAVLVLVLIFRPTGLLGHPEVEKV